MKKSNLIYAALVVILIIIGFYLRFDNLGKINFQNDEFFHVTTAKGYLETGTYVMWNFLDKAPISDYIRAFPYTWLVSQSFNIFGVDEFASRLPSLLFGVLLLPLVYFVAYKITGNKLVALLSLLLIVFDNSFIWSSRLCRMYSMFTFCAVLSSYLLYNGLEGKDKKFNYYYLVLGSALFILSYLVHEATLLFGLGFLVYFLINYKDKRYKILSLVSLSALAIFLLVHFFVQPLTTNEFFTIRLDPNFEYFAYPFNQLRFVTAAAWLILLLGLFLWEKKERIKIYYLSLFVPIILFLVFIGERYPAKKYLLFIIPFILILYVDSFYLLFKKIINSKRFIYIFIIIFFLFGPLLSWPGINKNFFFQKSLSDNNYENAELHNFKEAYRHIEDNYHKNEPIIIQGEQSYYFTRADLNFISMKSYKEFTLDEIKQIINKNKSGWVVWPRYKEKFHIKDTVANYCQKNLSSVKELDNTNIIVYHWDYR